MTLTLFATYIVQTTFAVTLLIGAVLLVRRPFATAFGAKAAYALWAIPFLRLIMPPMPANWTLFGLLTRPDTATPETVIRLTDPLLWQPTGFASGAAHQTLTLSNTFSPISAAPQNAFNLPVSLEAMLPFILSLWALGMLAAFARTLIRQRQAAALILAESHNISPALVTLAKETQMQLGLTKCNIAIKTSLLSSGPLVTGLIRPTVLLPEWFEDDYTITEQRFALMHEMMHVKRGDIFALYAANLALALQWFNPLAWLALRAFRADQEAACDADVLALKNTSPHDYGATLVKAARMSRPVAQPVHAASLPLNHALQERLTTMKNPLPSARRRLTGSLLTASVGAAALIASACATSTAQTADLAGGEEDVKAEVRVQSIFISDDSDETRNVRILKNGEEIDLEELDIEGLEGKRQIRIITQDHNGPTALNDSNVFVMKANSDNPRPDSAAFAAKIRELSKDAAKNQAEIQALAQAFEAEMEAWAEAHSKLITGHAVFASSDFSWTEDNADCGEGGTQTRTVIVNRDDDTGSEEKTVTVHCSTKTIDTAAIMANLRDRGDLSDERLADIEARLEEAKERLANGQTSGGKIRFNFDVDTEKSEGE